MTYHLDSNWPYSMDLNSSDEQSEFPAIQWLELRLHMGDVINEREVDCEALK